MLARSHRFHGHNSLNLVYRKGKVARGPLFGVRCLANPRRERYRAAVVVSRKVSKSAFTRNRIRRRLYEALRTLEPQPGACDLVLNVFSDRLATLPAEELRRSLQAQLKKAGAFPPSP